MNQQSAYDIVAALRDMGEVMTTISVTLQMMTFMITVAFVFQVFRAWEDWFKSEGKSK